MPKQNKKQKRKQAHQAQQTERFCHSAYAKRPRHAVNADPAKLAHNNTYDPLPEWYEDRTFACVECGTVEVWTAVQQKWWYEIAKGHIHSHAVRCSSCRKKRRDAREAQRLHMQKMAEAKGNAKH